MHKLTLLYGHPANPEAFEEHYLHTHLPLAAKMEGVLRLELTKFHAAPDGSKPAFYRMAELYYPGQVEIEKSLRSPSGQAVAGDLPNFATGGYTFIIGTAEF